MVADLKELPTLDELIGRPAWQRRAACRGLGTAGFIAGRGGRAGYVRAKETCACCPVRQECLEVALENDDLVGMWGGTTANERRMIRAGRGVA
jgi:WhiB family redox-sensing transcriptional regulator